MSELPPALLAALAAPMTHAVVTRFASGKLRRFASRSFASADNFASRERRKIGRKLICTLTRELVEVTSVDVMTLAEERELLAAEYIALIGYDPFTDDSAMDSATVLQTLNEWRDAMAYNIKACEALAKGESN